MQVLCEADTVTHDPMAILERRAGEESLVASAEMFAHTIINGVYVSNINTSEQIVISGERMAIARALDMASARGAKRAIPLRVGGAFHSGLMEPAKAGLVEAVNKLHFNDPKIPIVANCTGKPLATAESVKQELVSQICECVQWKRSIDYMVGDGVSNFIEIGPGTSLSSMVKRISRNAKVASVWDIDSILSLHRN